MNEGEQAGRRAQVMLYMVLFAVWPHINLLCGVMLCICIIQVIPWTQLL